MRKAVSLITFLMAFNSQAFGTNQIMNATFVGQDEANIYGQTESGEGFVLPIGQRSGEGFHRMPRTSCYEGNFIFVCFGVKHPPKFPEGVYDLNLEDGGNVTTGRR